MPKRASQEQLIQLFKQTKCWTIEQLCQKFNCAAISVRRLLKKTGYFSSFTHNSKWYTLSTIPRFNENGLWFNEDIGFSKYYGIKKTILHLINRSYNGLSAKELSEKLMVSCYAVLNHMYKSEAIYRFKTDNDFIYLPVDENKRKQQLARIQTQAAYVNIHQDLNAQAAVYVLVNFIKNPQASFEELSREVAKKRIIASPKVIEQFFKEHDLKKTLR